MSITLGVVLTRASGWVLHQGGGVVNARNSRRLRKIKAEYRRERPQPCMRCGQPIDYDAAVGEPNAFNLGHIKDWHNHPDLREDRGNVRQEHESCNKSAGIGNDLPTIGMQTRQW